MRPKILCLHGGGTNADIFRIQSRKIALLLSPHFDLVYLDGPLQCNAGPGVLPIFEGAGPYRQWLHDNHPPLAGQEEEQEWSGLNQLMAAFKEKGPFVGVMGFSQGCKAALHLVRRLEEERSRGSLQFALLVCGTAPFQGARDDSGRGRQFKASLDKGVVKGVESIHVIADDDPWRPESDALLQFFDEQTRRVIRAQGGHHMPTEDKINKLLSGLVLSCYEGV